MISTYRLWWGSVSLDPIKLNTELKLRICKKTDSDKFGENRAQYAASVVFTDCQAFKAFTACRVLEYEDTDNDANDQIYVIKYTDHVSRTLPHCVVCNLQALRSEYLSLESVSDMSLYFQDLIQIGYIPEEF
ncbi:hypothetical protein J6590_069979 [Homalodisca vitripennis]|nr:hypothetical protein J6590_069979 [Homalodisca vitripennis]